MSRRDWLGVIMLFWLAFFLRVHVIEMLPPFNDESLHIRRAEVVFSDRDVGLTPSKTLVYFWVGLFGVDREGGVWVGRVAISLFALLGLASVYATTKYLFSRWAGLLALLLAVFSPFLIFFDRLLLSDPFAAVLAVLLIWLSIRLARKPTRPLAIGTGVMLFLVIFAKILNLPMVLIPPLGLLCYGTPTWPAHYHPRAIWQWGQQQLVSHRKTLITLYITFGVCWVPSILHVLERILSGQQVMIVNNNLVSGLAETKTPFEILRDNLGTLWDINWILHSPLLWVLILLATPYLLWQRKRDGFFLMASIALAWSLSVILGAELSTRYLLPGIMILFVLVGGAADAVRQQLPSFQWGIWAIAVAWILGFAGPFVYTAWDDPTHLALPPRDEWEYFSNFSSGYGLVDAAKDFYVLPTSQPSGRINVLGLVGSCHQIRLYLPNAYADDDGPVWLTCLDFGWRGENIPQIIAEIEERLQTESAVYLITEPDLPFFDITTLYGYWEWRIEKSYTRPHDGMRIVLYYIRPYHSRPLTQTKKPTG